LVTVAIGAEYIKREAKTGASKQGYARKWNYTYLPYAWDTPDAFLSWAYSTELGSRFPHGALRMINPVLKYMAMHDALTTQRCSLALWTDADAVILNWDIEASFTYPGAATSSASSKPPYAMYVADKAPRGMPPEINDTDVDWCSSHSPCTSFNTFRSCFNSGVFLLNDSPAALDYLYRVVSGAASNISRSHDCSTFHTNPYGADMCSESKKDKDQCISGCVWKQEKRDDDDEMPAGVMCVAPDVRPRRQQVLKDFVDDVPGYIHADTFVVNVGGGPNRAPKDKLLEKLFVAYPHLASADARPSSVARAV